MPFPSRFQSSAPWLALLSGLALGIGSHVSAGLSGLQYLSLVPLLWVVGRPTTLTGRQAFAFGWLAGCVRAVVIHGWLWQNFRGYFGFSVLGAALLLCGWSAYRALRLAFFAWLARGALLRWRRAAWGLPMLYAGVEFAFPVIVHDHLGASFYQWPRMLQLAELGGIHLVSACVVGVNVAVFVGFKSAGRRRVYAWSGAVALTAMCFAYGAWRERVVISAVRLAPTLRVGVVQPGVDTPDERGEAAEALHALIAQTQRLIRRQAQQGRPLDLLVWPESSYPTVLLRPVEGLRGVLPVSLGVPLLLDATTRRRDDADAVYNTALLLDASGRVTGFYDKMHPVPFGERIPVIEHIPALRELIPLDYRVRGGEALRLITLPGGRSAGIFICYEDMLEAHGNALMRLGKPAALFNLTNDSWFTQTLAPEMHGGIARIRAVEQRRGLIRATKTGLTMYVDPLGRPARRLPKARAAAFVVELPLLDAPSPLASYGWLFKWLCLLLILGVGFRLSIRRASRISEAT